MFLIIVKLFFFIDVIVVLGFFFGGLFIGFYIRLDYLLSISLEGWRVFS